MSLKVTIHGGEFYKVDEENQTISIHDKWKESMSIAEYNSAMETLENFLNDISKYYAQITFATE